MEEHPLKPAVIDVLKTIFDPEIPVNIYDLGLIYDVEIDEANKATITMTLTTPGCPVAGTFPGMVQERVLSVEGITDAHVELVWEPMWTQEMMTEAAKLTLGFL